LARVPDGAIATPDGDEVDATRWFSREELTSPVVSDFALNTLRAIGWLNPVAH
jgi:hypothetical protein